MQFRRQFQQLSLKQDELGKSGVSEHDISQSQDYDVSTYISAKYGAWGLQDALEQVLSLQPEFDAKNTPAMVERGDFIRDIITHSVRRILSTFALPSGYDLEIQGGDGIGSRARIPWTRIYSPVHSPTPTAGWYLVYLFSFDGSTVYLSLNQGTANPTGNKNKNLKEKPRTEISGNVRRAREYLYQDTIDPGVLATAIQLDPGYRGLSSTYEQGNVFAIRYERGGVPSNKQLADDLAIMVDLLDQLYDPAFDKFSERFKLSEKLDQPKTLKVPHQPKRLRNEQDSKPSLTTEGSAVLVAKQMTEADLRVGQVYKIPQGPTIPAREMEIIELSDSPNGVWVLSESLSRPLVRSITILDEFLRLVERPSAIPSDRAAPIPYTAGTLSSDTVHSKRAAGLQRALERVLSLQPEFDSKNTPAMRERGLLVRNEITASLRTILRTLPQQSHSGQLEIQGRDGTGFKTRIPWARVYSPIYSPRPTIGWYLVYLFAYEGSSVYLSLNQGTQDWKYGALVQKPIQEISGRAKWARQLLALDNSDVHNLVTDIQLVLEGNNLGAGYELGNVFAIRYERESVPAEDILARDLERMLNLLNQLYIFEAKALAGVSQKSIQPRPPASSRQKREWSEAEVVVLCAIFSVSRFSIGDDAKEECKRIAETFGRSPGTIDRQWRNIKDYLAGLPTPKVGSQVKYWAQRTLDEPVRTMSLANYYSRVNEWHLDGLLRVTEVNL